MFKTLATTTLTVAALAIALGSANAATQDYPYDAKAPTVSQNSIPSNLFTRQTAPEEAPVQVAQGCGWYAFAGAFQSRRNARRRANRVGGRILDLDRSNSPNAGLGYWVVARGPGNRRSARRWARQFRFNGAYDAYPARRCFYR